MRLFVIARVATLFVLITGCGLAASSCSTGESDANSSAVAVAPPSQSPTAAGSAVTTTTGVGTVFSATSESQASVISEGKAVARCDQLTPADVQFLMTDKASGPTVSPTGTDSNGQRCDFNNADADQTVEVLVGPSSDPTFGYAAQKSGKPGAVSLSGVGEQAFREADDYDPTADRNGVTCSVSASVDDIPAAATLIVGGHSITLTPTQESAVATALGTVCNRIFGSGNTTPDWTSLHS